MKKHPSPLKRSDTNLAEIDSYVFERSVIDMIELQKKNAKRGIKHDIYVLTKA